MDYTKKIWKTEEPIRKEDLQKYEDSLEKLANESKKAVSGASYSNGRLTIKVGG